MTLYELLTGRRPFVGEPLIVLHQIVHEEPPPPSVVNPKIPRDLEAITQKAMSKEISSRYTNCENLANDLWRWLVGEPILARPISTWERLARWARRNRVLASAIAATAAALLLVAALGFAMVAQQSAAKRQLTLSNETIRDEQAKTKTALDDVTKERDRAEEQARLAEAQTKIAEERRQAEAEQRKLAEERLEVSQANAYVASIRLAAAKWEGGDSVGMNAALDAVRPKPGEKDRRGWEWNYLWNRSHREIVTIPIGGYPVISPDGLSVISTESSKGRVVRDLRTGDIRLQLPEAAGLGVACFSPDSRWIYTGDSKGEFICWDATTGAKRYSLSGP